MPVDISEIIKQLNQINIGKNILNSEQKCLVIRTLNRIKYFLFPQFYHDSESKLLSFEEYVSLTKKELKEIFEILNRKDSDDVIVKFFESLVQVKQDLYYDIHAIHEGDPANYALDEIMLSYPGFLAILHHRIAHELYKLDIPIISRIYSEEAHKLTGIDIHPGAIIGPGIFIDHGTGVVIGETSVIGKNCRIYQGVTLGALSLKEGRLLQGIKRHPTLKDNVTIYSNSSIFGGETVIGNNVTINSNSIITHSIEDVI
jgi:serine O-acetyltransferase